MVLFKDFVKIIRNINNINNDIIRVNKLNKYHKLYYNDDIYQKKKILKDHLNFQLFNLQNNIDINNNIKIINIFDNE